MGTARRIYRNTVSLGLAEIVSKLLQFVVMLYAARLLSKEHFGKFSFALSLSLIALVSADLGINSMLVREVSRNKGLAGRYFGVALSAKIMLSAVSFAIVHLILNAAGYPQDTRQITYIIWLFTILSTFTELFYSIFRAFEMMFYDAFLKILRMSLLAVASLYVLFKDYGVVVFSSIFVAVEIVVVLAAASIAARKFIKISICLDFGQAMELVKKALPFGLAFVFGSIYFHIGSVMLSKMGGDVEVAAYSAAYNIALAILFVPTVYTNAIYPVLSRCFRESEKGLRLIYERSFKYLYILGLPISVGIFALAPEITEFLYGSAYAESAIALQIISFYLFIKFVNFLLGIILSSTDQQKKRMYGQGITAIFNILLNLVLIPMYGFAGAAWSTFATEIFLFMVYYRNVSKSLYAYNFAPMLIRPALASIAMLVFIKYAGFGLAVTILGSAAVYSALILALGTLDSEDRMIIRSIFKNEKLQAVG